MRWNAVSAILGTLADGPSARVLSLPCLAYVDGCCSQPASYDGKSTALKDNIVKEAAKWGERISRIAANSGSDFSLEETP